MLMQTEKDKVDEVQNAVTTKALVSGIVKKHEKELPVFYDTGKIQLQMLKIRNEAIQQFKLHPNDTALMLLSIANDMKATSKPLSEKEAVSKSIQRISEEMRNFEALSEKTQSDMAHNYNIKLETEHDPLKLKRIARKENFQDRMEGILDNLYFSFAQDFNLRVLPEYQAAAAAVRIRCNNPQNMLKKITETIDSEHGVQLLMLFGQGEKPAKEEKLIEFIKKEMKSYGISSLQDASLTLDIEKLDKENRRFLDALIANYLGAVVKELKRYEGIEGELIKPNFLSPKLMKADRNTLMNVLEEWKLGEGVRQALEESADVLGRKGWALRWAYAGVGNENIFLYAEQPPNKEVIHLAIIKRANECELEGSVKITRGYTNPILSNEVAKEVRVASEYIKDIAEFETGVASSNLKGVERVKESRDALLDESKWGEFIKERKKEAAEEVTQAAEETSVLGRKLNEGSRG
jgi:hypothetical protein